MRRTNQRNDRSLRTVRPQSADSSAPDGGTQTSRRRFLALAGAGTAAVLLGRDSIGRAANTPGLQSFDGATAANGILQFHSRPDLLPPQVVVDTPASGQLGGMVITDIHGGPSQTGPLIIDQQGRIVWFAPLSPQPSAAHRAFNVQVTEYQGKPVLAWFQGAVVNAHGQGSYTLVDTRYSQVAQVHAQNGYLGDLHEFVLTPQGTALFTCYGQGRGQVRYNGTVRQVAYFYGVVQEVDVATGKLLFQWRSDHHVPLTDSYIAPTTTIGGFWDYFHINSIAIDPVDQNLVISGRNTATVYKVNRTTGEVMWRMGGKRSQFHLGPGSRFFFQHDVKPHPAGVWTVFDNEGGPPRHGPQSRALTLAVDERHRRVRLIRADLHQPAVYSAALGSVQPLSQGRVFVGWGQSTYLTEYNAQGQVLFDAHLATGGTPGGTSYRAFLQSWDGLPTAPPDVAIVRSGANATVYASWNGASALAGWMVNGGPSRSEMSVQGTAPVVGFETGITLPGAPAFIAVSAVDADGKVLATSKTVTS